MSKTSTNTIQIGGIAYQILASKSLPGLDREEITLRRPAGKRTYHAVRYADGSLSEAV